MTDMDRDGWFTSSFTNGSGACVEVKFDDGSVLVRDTKNRRDSTGSPMIAVDAAGWAAFVKSVAGR
jgi:Domain of unknown function (DUF397)